MRKISEYDGRRLMLMRENLAAFEKERIELCSLVGSLFVLYNGLESIEDQWGEKFMKDLSVLETINAHEIIEEAGEDISQIKKEYKESLTKKSVLNLKHLIEKQLSESSTFIDH